MRVIRAEDVRTAALRRIGWLFDEFDNIVVNHSGGKDSEAVWGLALEVARERDRLPLTTCFLDTEAEWQATVDRMEVVMGHPDVDPVWLQVPMRMYLGASSMMWFDSWHPDYEDVWMHPQHELAVTENTFGAERFNDVLTGWARERYPDQPVAKLLGIRAEESPARMFGLTSHEVWKGETWGAVEDRKRQHFMFNPIYDWSFSDVWKAILDSGLGYNGLYDLQWQRRTPMREMRVADLTSGDMSRNALYLAEVEPDTYARLQLRIGPEALERMEMRGWFPDTLPPMFRDWTDYRDYLLEHLIESPEWRDKMARRFASTEAKFPDHLHEQILRMQVGAVLIGDWKGTKAADWEAAHASDRITTKGAE